MFKDSVVWLLPSEIQPQTIKHGTLQHNAAPFLETLIDNRNVFSWNLITSIFNIDFSYDAERTVLSM